MFDSSRLRATAVAVVSLSLAQLACGAAGEGAPTGTNPPSNTPTTGTLVVLLQPLGNGRDADGFTATIDGASARTLASDATAVTYASLSPGDHTVRIAGIAPQCSTSTDNVTHTTKAGATDTVTVAMTCLGGIAYLEFIDDTRTDIVYLTEDGRTIQLTNEPGLRFIESWSPDGTRLLYSQFESDHFHLHSVRADGTDPKTLTSGSGNESAPQWSPDGMHIAYQQGDPTGIYIAISDADGTNVHPLAGTSPFDLDPTWSADGSRLYFGCDRFDRRHDLCTAALDGSDLRAIQFPSLDPVVTPCTPFCKSIMSHFAAAPGDGRISFEVLGGGELQRVWVAALDGTSAIPLSGTTTSFAGRWSPSGDRMLLNITDDNNRFALATVKPDGSSYLQITSYDDAMTSGDWSPDGKVIVYANESTGQIGVMNADGSGRRLITAGQFRTAAPTWNPKARAVGTLSGDLIRTSASRMKQFSMLSPLRREMLRSRFRANPPPATLQTRQSSGYAMESSSFVSTTIAAPR